VDQATTVRTRSRRDWLTILGRTGLVTKGVSYALVGVLAVGVALGIGGNATSRTGALHALAGNAFGKVVLVLLTAGFAAYALWRFLQVFYGDGWAKRLGGLARAAVYFGLAYSTARVVAGAGSTSQNQKAHKAAAVLLGWPGGPWLVGLAGGVIFAVGCWNLYRGLTRTFEDKWIERGEAAERWGGRAGAVGHCARFVVFALIGSFAIKAAVDYNPNDAVGLDGALQKLARESYGQVLLGLTAAGLVAYAIFCFVDARYRDFSK
jgi:Domain of Unknown Function (DUF1206)